ncbi:MAG TPA: hypothetical protein VF865_05705 [Acidobacteriaceae bacterium]
MADPTFPQPESRNFLIPALVVAVIVAIAFALIYFFTPHRIADLTVTHTAILPVHTEFQTGSKVVGHQNQGQDDLYVLATVRIDDKLKLPIFIKDITGTLVAPDDTATDTSAIEKNDLDNLYVTFPALKPLAGAPLLREITIQPGDHAEGMVLLHFPATEADWKQRKSATVTIDLYHQGPQTVAIPKP